MAQCRCGHGWFWHEGDPPRHCRREGCSCSSFKTDDPEVPADAERVVRRTARVLVIDDEPLVRKLFRRVLEDAGFQVVVAADGEEGLTMLRSGPSVCVVLLDLKMPKMDGTAFRNAQRRDQRLAAIPTVVVTGSPVPEPLRRELCAADYLLKPVKRDDLIRAVERFCRRPA